MCCGPDSPHLIASGTHHTPRVTSRCPRTFGPHHGDGTAVERSGPTWKWKRALWSSAAVSNGQPDRLMQKGVTAFPLILAYLYPHSLFICTFQAHMASPFGRRLFWQASEHPSLYQPALLSSPAKLLLGCISIAISQSNTTLVIDHSGSISRRLVCRSPQIQFLRARQAPCYT